MKKMWLVVLTDPEFKTQHTSIVTASSRKMAIVVAVGVNNKNYGIKHNVLHVYRVGAGCRKERMRNKELRRHGHAPQKSGWTLTCNDYWYRIDLTKNCYNLERNH